MRLNGRRSLKFAPSNYPGSVLCGIRADHGALAPAFMPVRIGDYGDGGGRSDAVAPHYLPRPVLIPCPATPNLS